MKDQLTVLHVSRPPARRVVRRGLAAAGAAAVASAVCCYASYRFDGVRLRHVAEEAALTSDLPSQRVLSLVDWVYHHRGFHENRGYFVLPGLRATPVQVLEDGGDCADKSRLLTALLREIGIPSTMVMCFNRSTGVPSHTVVEAKIENDSYMVVDPVYRLWFPRSDGTGYHDLLDLRHDPDILDRRLDELLAVAPRRSPLRSYNRLSAVYDRATSINWDKNAVTRLLHDRLRINYGDAVYRIPRPMVVEEPKLFVAAALAAMGSVCIGSTIVVRPSKRRSELPVSHRSIVACGL